jgi:GT2 family glycosyltransferase/SAM-dependent methyltransferase
MAFELLRPGEASALLRPRLGKLRGVDYDQLQRYLAVARVLDRMLGQVAGPVRLLEVGSNVLDVLSLMFADGAARVHRCDVEPTGTGPEFTLLERGKPLPFAGGSFDAVVSLEVLEHVPAAERPRFLAECLRVARHGAVFTCPDGTPEVATHEAQAADAYRYRTGAEHPFLREHVEFGLPRQEDVTAALRELGCDHAVFANSPLDMWLATIVLSETVGATAPQPAELRGVINEVLFPADTAARGGAYRKVYVCAKTPEARAALDTPVPAAGVRDRTGPVAPLQALAALTSGVMMRMARERRADVVRLRRQANRWRLDAKGLRRQVLHARAAQDQLRAQLEETERDRLRLWERGKVLEVQLRGLLSTRVVRMARLVHRLRELLWPHAYGARALEAIRSLDRVSADAWQATDGNAVFLLHVQTPPGPVRLCLQIDSHVGATAAVDIADGGNFVELARLEVGQRTGAARLEKWYDFPRGIRTLRLRPLNRPGRFRIREFRVTAAAPPRRLWHALVGTVAPFAAPPEPVSLIPPPRPPGPYEVWCAQRRLTDADRAALRAAARKMADPPFFSVLLPVYNTPAALLRCTLESVLRQTYPHWELCVADDGSTAEHVRPLLAEYRRRDGRIRVTYRDTNGNISAASNTALGMARGEYVALLDHDDELAEHALSRVAEAVAADRDLDMVYSDEDKLEMDGTRCDPSFKPDWSPEFFLACMYTCHLGVYRTSLVREVGGFRSEFDGAQDYDLVLRLTARTSRIHHIPDVLYHWRLAPTSTALNIAAKPYAPDAARRALEAHLSETGRRGRVEPGPFPCMFRIRYALRGRPKVSVIIPSACRPVIAGGEETYYAARCAESIRRRTTYENYEVVLLHQGEVPGPLARQLARGGVGSVAYTGPFNWSRVNNLGARACSGEHLLFLNDDTEVITPDWLESLLEFSQEADIGAVGAKLLFPDGRVQHAGVAVLDGEPTHPLMGSPGDVPGPISSLVLHRNWSAVTGACLMTRRAVFEEVGGFDERFAVCYNDVDYCLRVRRSGRRVVFQPAAMLQHHESASRERGSEPHDQELRHFRDLWGRACARDPYYNPNLSYEHLDGRVDTRPPERPAATATQPPAPTRAAHCHTA